MTPRPGRVARVLDRGIGGYQAVISPLLTPRCRFAPSCSDYAREAITRHGAVRGGWLAARRLSRCHPFHEGGLDLVPGHEEPVVPPRAEADLGSTDLHPTSGATR